MICKKCGFEYIDGLKECPNCQTPNEPAEVKVLTEDERDTFDGITIEESQNESQEQYRNYEQETRQEKPKTSGIYVKSFGVTSFLWQLLILLIIAGVIFIILPAFLMIFLGIALVYFVIRMFR